MQQHSIGPVYHPRTGLVPSTNPIAGRRVTTSEDLMNELQHETGVDAKIGLGKNTYRIGKIVPHYGTSEQHPGAAPWWVYALLDALPLLPRAARCASTAWCSRESTATRKDRSIELTDRSNDSCRLNLITISFSQELANSSQANGQRIKLLFRGKDGLIYIQISKEDNLI